MRDERAQEEFELDRVLDQGVVMVGERMVKRSVRVITEIFDEALFKPEVLEVPGLVLVDFWAKWCGPCQVLAPVIDLMAVRYNGKIKFVKMNVAKGEKLVARYKVLSIPTLIIFKGGHEVERIVGLRSRSELGKLLDVVVGC